MNRPLRVLMIFLGLLSLLAAQAAWQFKLTHALPLLGGLAFVQVVLLALVFRGRTPGFSRAERRRLFGRLAD